jgi:hypothetical protein
VGGEVSIDDELPDSRLERAALLESEMTASATGQATRGQIYENLRREFMADPETKALLPHFVRTSRTLGAFWPWIKEQDGSYAGRRRLISTAFGPLSEYLEGRNNLPADAEISDKLASFDADGVQAVWTKALQRRTADPEGAITAARTLLETVCKQVLDRRALAYDDKDDLPALYGKASRALSLAPSQHTEEAFKAILGGCHTVVNGLGSLRNKLSDAHGRGGKPVRPAERHASLAVNVAGAVALFLVETANARDSEARDRE